MDGLITAGLVVLFLVLFFASAQVAALLLYELTKRR